MEAPTTQLRGAFSFLFLFLVVSSTADLQAGTPDCMTHAWSHFASMCSSAGVMVRAKLGRRHGRVVFSWVGRCVPIRRDRPVGLLHATVKRPSLGLIQPLVGHLLATHCGISASKRKRDREKLCDRTSRFVEPPRRYTVSSPGKVHCARQGVGYHCL